MLLDDNTVMPSYMGARPMGDTSPDTGYFSDMGMRSGEVREIIYPSDERSLSKKYTEYTVETSIFSEGTSTTQTYFNCALINQFGGVADKIHYTLRPSDKSRPTEDGIGVGSKVLLLCIDGKRSQAIILGGVREAGKLKENETTEKKENGHNLFFEFNGVRTEINDDGELTVQFRGATQNDGKLRDSADSKASGSKIILNKTGGIKIHTADEDQYIFIDHSTKKINVLADDEWSVKVNNKLSFDVGGDINVKGNAEAKIDILANVKITSAGVHVGSATDAWMKGTTYRASETTMHTTMTAAFSAMAAAFGTLGGALSSASALHVIPIAGPIIAAPTVAAAGAAAVAAATAAGQVVSAIGAFEGQSLSYLSLKNLTD